MIIKFPLKESLLIHLFIFSLSDYGKVYLLLQFPADRFRIVQANSFFS